MRALILLPILLTAVLTVGCSTAKFSSSQHMGVMLNLTTNDVIIEKKIAHSIPYDKNDIDLKSTVYESAIKFTGYDLILLPSYEIIISSSPFIDNMITVTGYGAKLKGVVGLPKPEPKVEAKKDVKPEIKADAKPEPKADTKIESKPEIITEQKPENLAPTSETTPTTNIDNKN